MLNWSAAVEIQSRRFLHSRLCLQNKTSTQQRIHIGARALGQSRKATGGDKVGSDKMRQEKNMHPLGCMCRLDIIKMITESTLQKSWSEFNKYLKASSNLKSSRLRRMALLIIDALLLLSPPFSFPSMSAPHPSPPVNEFSSASAHCSNNCCLASM